MIEKLKIIAKVKEGNRLYICAYQSLIEDDFFEFGLSVANSEKESNISVSVFAKNELDKEIERLEELLKNYNPLLKESLELRLNLERKIKELKSRKLRKPFVKSLPLMGLGLQTFYQVKNNDLETNPEEQNG